MLPVTNEGEFSSPHIPLDLLNTISSLKSLRVAPSAPQILCRQIIPLKFNWS